MSPAKRGPYRKNDVAQKRLRIKEYVPPNTQNKKPKITEVENTVTEKVVPQHNTEENEDENQTKKRHGSWTDEKELALMRAYVNVFPPAWRRGTVSDGWRKVIEQVNAVAPNDTPLEYDACRRNVDRIMNKVKNSTMSRGHRYQQEMEEAALSGLRKREAHEGIKGKKSKRYEIEAQNSNEAQEIPSTIALQTSQNGGQAREEIHLSDTQIEEESHTEDEVEYPTREELNRTCEALDVISPPQVTNPSATTPTPPPPSTVATTVEAQLLQEQREFQKSVLSALESIANSTRRTEKLLKLMLIQTQTKN